MYYSINKEFSQLTYRVMILTYHFFIMKKEFDNYNKFLRSKINVKNKIVSLQPKVRKRAIFRLTEN